MQTNFTNNNFKHNINNKNNKKMKETIFQKDDSESDIKNGKDCYGLLKQNQYTIQPKD